MPATTLQRLGHMITPSLKGPKVPVRGWDLPDVGTQHKMAESSGVE